MDVNAESLYFAAAPHIENNSQSTPQHKSIWPAIIISVFISLWSFYIGIGILVIILITRDDPQIETQETITPAAANTIIDINLSGSDPSIPTTDTCVGRIDILGDLKE